MMIVETDAGAQQGQVKVVNIGGSLDNFITSRSQRPDFRHVDLNPGPNTIVANVNQVGLETIFQGHIRFLRASNVPFIEVPTGAFVEPSAFVRQAQSLQVKRIVITTGRFSEFPIIDALSRAGFSVQRRVIHQRTFITARC
ncbi:hypothetical protein F4X10_11035 [Candidatus Poribacteria bacterium]|nr:hypothetical protein [Candidatus Poribacteria bacterium]